MTHQPTPAAIEQAIIDALVAHRVDREGPDFDYADPSLLGYARAVARVARTEADAAYQRGEATAYHRVAAYASHHLGNVPDSDEPIPAEVVAVVDMAMTVSREQGVVEGRRQATEGWEREWGVSADAGVYVYPTERDARDAVGRDLRGRVVSRLVGPWETAEQPADRLRADGDDVAPAPEQPEPDEDEPSCWPICEACFDGRKEDCARKAVEPATGGVVDPAPEAS